MEPIQRTVPDCRCCAKRHVSIFRSLEGEALARLESIRSSHRYRKGQVLHYEGTPSVGIHCLETGRAKIIRTAPGGKMCILRLVDPGEVLGLESLFCETHAHSTTAEMIEEGLVCLFERDPLLELIRENRELSATVLEFMACQLRTSEAERVELAVGDVRERTARALILLSQKYGEPLNGGTLIGLKLSREEIAEMIGAAAETVIRQLTEFRSEGLLENFGRQLVITDSARLARVAHLEDGNEA